MRKSDEETQLPLFFVDQTSTTTSDTATPKRVVSLCEARTALVKAAVKKQEQEVIGKIVTLSQKYKW